MFGVGQAGFGPPSEGPHDQDRSADVAERFEEAGADVWMFLRLLVGKLNARCQQDVGEFVDEEQHDEPKYKRDKVSERDGSLLPRNFSEKSGTAI